MGTVRFGIIGMGNMGLSHAKYVRDGEIKGAELTAVCDQSPEQVERAAAALGGNLKRFTSADELFASGSIDAVLIATPHYDHPELAIQALKHGLHVLIEKPAGVYTKQVRLMNEAAAASDRKFGIMYNQRTNPMYMKLRELIASGELGEIKRFSWIITDWYRSQAYYDSGSWRATWSYEGGGVLINQCPHNLDLMPWTLGMMPERIRAFCHYGKHRDIEVEDDVTAYMEFANGATGVFITSVADSPGTNRYEVTGDNGKIVIEHGKMTFWRNRIPESEFNRTNEKVFGRPEVWECSIPVPEGIGSQHRGITQNFVNAILHDEPLIAPGEEGINGLTISNMIHLSSWLDDWVKLPIDEELYLKLLQERIEASRTRKKTNVRKQTVSIDGSY